MAHGLLAGSLGADMRKSQPDSTHPLPDTAELGAEGGSFGDSASRHSRDTDGDRGRAERETITDTLGNVIRLPDVKPDAAPDAADDLRKYPTES